MNKLLLKASIVSATIIGLLAIGNVALASGDCIPSANTYCGTLSTGINASVGNNMNGVVIAPPIASPVAGVYTSAQNVTLTADGASSIYYTTDGVTAPTCSTGTLYSNSSPISVSSTETVIEAISCYPGGVSSVVQSYLYGIPPPSAGSAAVTNTGISSGGGGNVITSSVSTGGGGSISSGGGTATVGISDFVSLMANWGQTRSGNPANFNGDSATIGISDFIWLMANWTA